MLKVICHCHLVGVAVQEQERLLSAQGSESRPDGLQALDKHEQRIRNQQRFGDCPKWDFVTHIKPESKNFELRNLRLIETRRKPNNVPTSSAIHILSPVQRDRTRLND
jgi:hypothetical protein